MLKIFLNIKNYNPGILLILFISLFTSCQQYHDTTARFNAYFLAKEKMLEIEDNLFGKPQNNYNDILQVLPAIDTNASVGQKAGFEYIIEKASLPIQWHESSKWVDDCYIVIGKSRLYQGDFMNAVLTFRYVNTNSEDDEARHASLVLLIRTLFESDQMNTVPSVLDYIRKEKVPFNEENTRNYHLVMAQYNRYLEDFGKVALHLEKALPFVKNRADRTRFHYILGQIYQMQGLDTEAYENYDIALKLSPTYEMEFHSSLNRSGVQKIENEEDMIKASKYYRRLLSDEKNREFRDKIYYEMAKFAIKQKDYPTALNYLNESIQLSTSNTIQKSYSYLKAGEIYYYYLKDFEKAALYYDSTVQVMPPKIKEYEPTKELADILVEFSKYHSMVKEQDRLIMLSKLSEDERVSYLENEIETEREAVLLKKRNEDLRDERRKKVASAESADLEEKENAGWYFSNSTAKVFGRTNFIRKWGSRPLEDNWRRSKKELNSLPEEQVAGASGNNSKVEEQETKEDIFASIKPLSARQEEVPTTQEKMDAVLAKLDEGLFGLGKVYAYRLKEPENVFSTLERQAAEFPQGENTPEGIYIMYLICKEIDSCNHEMYKNTIISKYPESFYAKILINPNYVEESNIKNEEAEALYNQSFALFKETRYEYADSLLNKAINNYPENIYLDKIHLLKAMIVGKTTDDLKYYYFALNDFINDFEESDLVDYAKNLKSGLSTAHLDIGEPEENEPIEENKNEE
ncbi:MAG: hypothetical protein KTR26_13000 [Flammeovirgaceae bacterium]|nr:hypothetical protein [Flammeovirgaceae bacterium]